MSGVSAFSVLRNRDFFLYSLATLLAAFGAEILVIAIAWQIWAVTGNAADLGLLGLVQFLPNCVLVLVTGTVADRYSRKLVVTLCMAAELIFILAIFLVTSTTMTSVWPILVLVAGLAVGRAFMNPAALAWVPNLVEREQIPSAIACSTAAWQLSSIAGPALGGVLFSFSHSVAYTAALAMAFVAMIAVLFIRKTEQPRPKEVSAWDSLASPS